MFSDGRSYKFYGLARLSSDILLKWEDQNDRTIRGIFEIDFFTVKDLPFLAVKHLKNKLNHDRSIYFDFKHGMVAKTF